MKKFALSALALAAALSAPGMIAAQSSGTIAAQPAAEDLLTPPTVLNASPNVHPARPVTNVFTQNNWWDTPLPPDPNTNNDPFIEMEFGEVSLDQLFLRAERWARAITEFEIYVSDTPTFNLAGPADYTFTYAGPIAGSGASGDGTYYDLDPPITSKYVRFQGVTWNVQSDIRIAQLLFLGEQISPFPPGFPPVQSEWVDGLGFIPRQIVPPAINAASPNLIGIGPEKLFDNTHATLAESWRYYGVASQSNTEVDRAEPGAYVNDFPYVDMEFDGAVLSMGGLYFRNWRSNANTVTGIRLYTSSDGNFDMGSPADYTFEGLTASLDHIWELETPITDKHVRLLITQDIATAETGAGANARPSNLMFFGEQLLLPAEHDGGDVLFGNDLAVYTIYNNTDEELTIDGIDTTNFPTGFSLDTPASFPVTVPARENYDVVIGTDTSAVGEFAFDFTVNYTYDSASDSQVVSSSGEVFDDSAPTLTTVTIASDNAVDSTVAGPGDVITVSLTADKNIVAPTVTIAGGTAAVTGSGDSYTASRTVTGAFESGAATFEISGIEDPVGNAGTDVTATTDSSSVTIDTDAPETTLTADSDAVSGTEVGFTYSVADDSAVSGTLLLVKAPGEESFAAADAVFDNDTITYTATASGLHEFVAVSDDIAGNQEAVDEESATAVVVNMVENGALTLDVADGTDVTVTFPMADGINVTITFASVSVAGTVTVERLLGAANAVALELDPDDLAGQVAVITAGGGLTFTTATIVFDIDEALLGANVASLAAINTVFVNRGGTLTPITGGSVSTGAGAVTVTGVSEFSEWYPGISETNVNEWMLLND